MKTLNEPTPSLRATPLECRVADLTILLQVSLALQNLSDEEEALHAILVGVTHGRGLGFNRGFILLVDHEKELLEGRKAMGPSTTEEAVRICRYLREGHQTVSQLLQDSTAPEIVKDLKAHGIVSQLRLFLTDRFNPLLRIMRSHQACLAVDGKFEPHGFGIDPSLQSLLSVSAFAAAPLYHADEDLGLILADNAVTGAPIQIANLGLLQIYAQEASAAIQNIRLHRALIKKIELCERTNRALRENQAHLLQAERLSTIGEMAALLAHEIRTPLVSIGGFARRLHRATPPEDPRKEEMDIIISEVSRLEKLVHEVLGYSKLAEPEFRPTDVNSLVRSVLLMMGDEIARHSVHAVLDLAPSLLSAETDESQLRQALLNLVTNAIEAMPAGGFLTITTSLDGDYFEISVCDTGVGIAREHFGKLSKPFFTTKTGGTGLGLAVVSHIVDNHNGSLRFDSVLNRGTSFHLRLALHPKSNSAAPLSVPHSVICER
jgi:signal transduction histidine kinase